MQANGLVHRIVLGHGSGDPVYAAGEMRAKNGRVILKSRARDGQKSRFFGLYPQNDIGALGVEIQQPIQPNVIETVSRTFSHHRLCVIRDGNSRLRYHRKVVGAVADGDDLITR